MHSVMLNTPEVINHPFSSIFANFWHRMLSEISKSGQEDIWVVVNASAPKLQPILVNKLLCASLHKICYKKTLMLEVISCHCGSKLKLFNASFTLLDLVVLAFKVSS